MNRRLTLTLLLAAAVCPYFVDLGGSSIWDANEAFYVETPRETPDRIRRPDAEALQQNIRLAESLGATVVRVRAERPADGLIAFAQREGVTHVIFGQTARSRWEQVWRGSTLDRFLSAVPDAAVQVVPLAEA